MSASANTMILPVPEAPELVIGVIGCGVMGRGIAQIAALAGAHVRLVDSRAGAAETARLNLIETLGRQLEKGRLPRPLVDAAIGRISACCGLHDLTGAHVVIEAILEDLGAKKILFNELEHIVGSSTILASNTSSLSITAIAAGLLHPERVAGMHFFNPVPLMKLVEVVGGLLSAPAALDYLLALGAHWGHASVRAKDTPGFLVNHAGRAYGTEGLRILAEGITTVATLDDILRDCAGFKLGPCELMDLIGLDVSHPVMESIYQQYYEEPRFRPQGLTRQMLAAGLLGKKTGRGFYVYDGQGQKQVAPEAPVPAALPSSVWLSRANAAQAGRVESVIAGLCQKAGVLFEQGAKPGPQALCIVTPLGEDASSCASRQGLDARRSIAIETLFDSGRRRVIMSNPATEQVYLEMARGLFGNDGVAVSVIKDSAGLVAQRVVAHIVNVACEIAQQGIAEPFDIDRAVQLGLAYPQGPLAWGDQLGPAVVLTILENLLEQSGDPRYRPSSWLRRRAQLGLSLLHAECS